jgi:hypothetical protein
MNRQNFPERANHSSNVEQTAQYPSTPVKNSDSEAETPLDETIVQEAPMGQTVIYNEESMGETLERESPIGETNTELPAPLLTPNESEHLRARWNEIQGKFVDEPRSAVKQADALVGEVIEKITQLFTSEQSLLEDQWKQGSEVSTEDLRQTLQHYRAFFNRLTM